MSDFRITGPGLYRRRDKLAVRMVPSGAIHPYDLVALIRLDDEPERKPATGDGWREWHGGECPVASDAVVMLRFREGEETRRASRASGWRWSHRVGNSSGDIVAYKIVESGGVKPPTEERRTVFTNVPSSGPVVTGPFVVYPNPSPEVIAAAKDRDMLISRICRLERENSDLRERIENLRYELRQAQAQSGMCDTCGAMLAEANERHEHRARVSAVLGAAPERPEARPKFGRAS